MYLSCTAIQTIGRHTGLVALNLDTQMLRYGYGWISASYDHHQPCELIPWRARELRLTLIGVTLCLRFKTKSKATR